MLTLRRKSPVFTIAIILFCLLALAVPATAQRRKKAAAPKPAPKPAASSLAVKDQSAKIATEIKYVTRYLYILGGVAKTMEDIDKDPKASVAIKNQNRAAKQTVLQSIKDIRAGVAKLEGDFHAKPELRPYIRFIQGVSETAGIAEDQANAGQFNTAGKTLIEVVNKLTDALQNLR